MRQRGPLARSRISPVVRHKQQAGLLYLVEGRDAGSEAWHLVLVDKLKLPLFLHALKSRSLNVSEFGEIVLSGWGTAPSDEALKDIRARYA